MSKFPNVWNSSYEAIPADTEDESLGASRIRDLKVEVRERMQQDHSWNGDDSDGYHDSCTLLTQTSDPTPTPASGTAGSLYSKVVNGNNELFFKDSSGNVIQMTSGGTMVAGLPSGAMIPFAGVTAPSGYLLCFGQAVSRTTYATLFGAIGTTFGAGDGSTTFNLPDMRGRAAFGADAMGGTAAGRLGGGPAGSITGSAVVGASGGEQAHTLTSSECPADYLTATPRGASIGSLGGGPQLIYQNSGGNGASNNTPPALVTTYIIKT